MILPPRSGSTYSHVVSDNVLVIFPTDPGWVPNSQLANRAAEVIACLTAASGDQLELTRTDNIEFIDAGENFEAIRCPLCGHELDVDWWQDHMGRQYSRDDGFQLEPITAPCCGGATTLKELAYEWPLGFARWTAAVWNPGRGWLTDDELREVELALEHPVRQTFRHI
jgi:hypothetical protein